MFERAAVGTYKRDIYNWFEEVGMTTRKNKIVTLSMIYNMLNNTYYCGMFEFPIGRGWYKGSYKPIASRSLFDKVQEKMVVSPKSKPGTKHFDYTKLDFLK